MPRALACPGVSVASVGALESYGLFTGVSGGQNREILLDTVDRIYQPMNPDGIPSLRLLQTGRGALDGADLLAEAPNSYKSSIEYPEDNPIAQSLKGIAQVASARLGTRIFYAQHGSFDTHTDELKNHSLLWQQLSVAIDCFQKDLKEQLLEEVIEMHPGIMDVIVKLSAKEFTGEGEVDGPGTGTSDSIPAMLSDGEFVFTAKATKQLGVDKLRKMMKQAEAEYDNSMAVQDSQMESGQPMMAKGGLLSADKYKI